MIIYDGLQSLDGAHGGAVVAIGVFDGVHRGHQEILKQSVREAHSQGLTPVALTFDIHPTELFSPDHAPPYIASLRQRGELIDRYGGGIESVVVVHFNREFASLPPDAFVRDVLKAQLSARHILVGADFCYGRGRSGNVTTLIRAGAENDFSVTVVPPILLNGERISSTRIRSLIAEGDIAGATALLGHSFQVDGAVAAGKKLGRKLGFPTANIEPIQHKQLLPATGIYAAYAHLPDGRSVRAAVSVGYNPTTDNDGIVKVEAHLLDGFDEDLYGQKIGIDFLLKIRNELKLETLDQLIARINLDIGEVARRIPFIEGKD
jgi:riboflavin kinase/FMN adenylyltransferase